MENTDKKLPDRISQRETPTGEPEFLYKIPELYCYKCRTLMISNAHENNLWFGCPNCKDWMNFLWQCTICGEVLNQPLNYCDACMLQFDIPDQDMPQWGIPEFAHLLRERPFTDQVVEWKLDLDGDVILCTAILHAEGGRFWWAWFTPYWQNQRIFAGRYDTAAEMFRAVYEKAKELIDG